MNILEIYQKYQIMPQLIQHQLKVAAAASLICNHFHPSPQPSPARGEGEKMEALSQMEREDVVAACLLHDMGNIVKFDLSITNQLHSELALKPEEIQHWEQIQQEFKSRYGSNSHKATMNIVKQMGVNERIRELVDCIGFDKGKENAQSHDFDRKICAYSDMRVGPKGVVSLKERMADLRLRYQNDRALLPPQLAVEFEQALKEIEKQIFAKTDITPDDISEEAINQIIPNLKNFSI